MFGKKPKEQLTNIVADYWCPKCGESVFLYATHDHDYVGCKKCGKHFEKDKLEKYKLVIK